MAIVLPQTIKDMLTSNELTSLLHITDIGYYPKAEGHYRSRKEGADQHILIYCTDGKRWVNIHNTRYNLKKEEFFIIEAGTPHSYGAAEKEPWSIYWIHFYGEKSHLFSSIYNKVIRIEDSPEARFGDRLLISQYKKRNKG